MGARFSNTILLIILKERESLSQSMWYTFILFDVFLYPSFKGTKNFANAARTTASASKFIQKKKFKLPGIGSLYEQ